MKAARKHSESPAAENCDLCNRVPGINPSEVAGPGVCEPGALEKLIAKAEKAVVYVRQDGCKVCESMEKEVLAKIPFDGVPKIEITAGKVPTCDKLADELKIEATPTLLFYAKGKEVSRMQGARKAQEDIGEILKRTGLQAKAN